MGVQVPVEASGMGFPEDGVADEPLMQVLGPLEEQNTLNL